MRWPKHAFAPQTLSKQVRHTPDSMQIRLSGSSAQVQQKNIVRPRRTSKWLFPCQSQHLCSEAK